MKLWQKNHQLNKEIETFTVENDFVLDQKLLKYDIKVNLAHAKMLNKINILSKTELEKIIKTLNQINKLAQKGKFKIKKEQEDVHTAIEEFLTKKLGNIGKKIHTGKSRNDQVMTDLLLYCKDELDMIKKSILDLIKELDAFSKKHSGIPMPGYTHMQKAMPYSVSEWILSFKEMLEDDIQSITQALSLIDKNPLGSAAGYGLPIEIDKQLTTNELGFKIPHKHALYVQNSHGKYEIAVLSAINQSMMTINKLSTDLLLFTTSEFNFFTLPDEFCTGSSIMPQKKNYDVLELVKGKTKLIQPKIFEISLLYSNLPSGYNRDLQLMKEPLMKGIEISKSVLKIINLVVKNLKPNKLALAKAMTSELYATEKALNLVKKGIPFRDAYKKLKN
ncbi:argininosuccinate lyase [Candidatus Woesearchaeota archaeon]|nr:argininosuccinate lyase [Candidatus Woesearchaeota archaeon]